MPPEYKRIGLSFHEWDLKKLDKIARAMGESRSRAIVRLIDFYEKFKCNTNMSTSSIMDMKELTDSLHKMGKNSAMDD